ncbi:hypothetical protein AB0J63_26575 [Streptosporangium canum]|uniref:hypothetical protein n=1 Tax=Streptosporangium canum TaxID=324952 RepID=UPI00342BFE28
MTLPSKPLVEALLAMVQGAVPVTCPIYWAQAAASPGQTYAVFYPDTGTLSAFHRDLLNRGPDELRYQVTSVGQSPEQAAWVADRVAEALLSAVPTVAGRRVWPAIEEGSQPVRRDDESTGLFFATAQYLTRSDLP